MLKYSLWTILVTLLLNGATKAILTSSNSLSESKFKDFTVDDSGSCKNVDIELAEGVSQLSGILHSSYYNELPMSASEINASCKWRFNADSDHQINLIFVEYRADCGLLTETKSELIIESNKSLWINVHEAENATELTLPDNQFKSCGFNLKPFTELRTVARSLAIEYERGSIEFLIFFTISKEIGVKSECAEINCSVEYRLEGSTKTHDSCVPSQLLCRCAGDCEKLVERYSEFYLEQETLNDSCQHFAEMNDLCERANNLFQPLIKSTEESEADTIDRLEVSKSRFLSRKFVQSKSQQDHMVCGNLRFSSEYGWISSPDFDMSKSYANDQDCFYLINLQPNQKVQLRFKYFDLNTNVTTVPLLSGVVSLSSGSRRNSVVLNEASSLKDDAIVLTSNMLRNFFASNTKLQSEAETDGAASKMPPNLGITYDYDYVNIYDGPSTEFPLIAHLTSKYNNFNQHFNGYVINSKTNNLLIKFHSAARPVDEGSIVVDNSPPQLHQGFNLTYQIKGFCIEDQRSCNSIYELNCFSPGQVCNDAWDCHNGADERGCGPCKHEQFRCKNHIFCYRLEDRCDGDHQCLDFSDEMNCNSWFCNSNNGTFLCDNEQCVYEQWVCDGTNDCRDGSDERNCPTPFTRRVITTAVLGGTLCSLLLVMALGCACKLYTLHTVGYRNNIRLSQTVQSAAAAAAAAPLLTSANLQIPTVATLPSSLSSQAATTTTSTEMNTVSNPEASGSINRSTSTGIINNFSNIFRRNNSEAERPTTSALPAAATAANEPSTGAHTGYQFNFNNTANSAAASAVAPGELPLPHHLIAPPTYNQTMGLVDEYEQRQLAFIEHVRSILAQQQSQSGAGNLNLINLNTSGQSSFAALTLIPTVTSSSTTVHRVNSSSRRSHTNGRHHRHHYHHRSSSSSNTNNNNNVDSGGSPLQAAATAAGASLAPDPMSGGVGGSVNGSGGRSHRSHRHHYRHANSSHSRGHSIHHHITNNLTQVNFDANRRGLITQPEVQSSQASGQSTSTTAQSSTQNQSQPRTSSTAHQQVPETLATTSGNNLTSTLTQMSNKTTSVNLRDKIAKLIKDIVVHHGDNIQYVQLADQLNSSSRNNSSVQSPENSIELTSSSRIISNDANNNSSNQNQETFIDNNLEAHNPPNSNNNAMNTSNSNSNNNNNGSEDDVPLIQP